ncbi:MAG: hypothetical protein ACYC9S_11095 [Leptospirales bacterium]
MVKKMAAVGAILVLMVVMNPGINEFDGFILRHIKEQQNVRKGDFKDGMLSFFGPTFVEQLSERKNYLFFSIYTLRFPNKPPRYFLGMLHLFIPV